MSKKKNSVGKINQIFFVELQKFVQNLPICFSKLISVSLFY